MQPKPKTDSKPMNKLLSRSLLALGILCFLLAAVLSYQFASRIRSMQFPIPREASVNQIESWMTIRYISRTYHVPERILSEKLSLTPAQTRNMSLEKIAKQKGIDIDTFITQVKHILLDHSPAHTLPPVQTN